MFDRLQYGCSASLLVEVASTPMHLGHSNLNSESMQMFWSQPSSEGWLGEATGAPFRDLQPNAAARHPIALPMGAPVEKPGLSAVPCHLAKT